MAARSARWWRWPLYGLGALLGLVLLVAVLLQTAFAREQVRTQVNSALGPLFRGKIQIDRLDGLGLWGVSGVDARVYDPAGRQVIRAQGLEARAALPALAWQLLFGGPSPRLTIDRARIDFVDVTLREDEELGVTLARTFELAEEDEPSAPDEAEGTVELHLPDIRLRRIWAHGRVAGSPALDADLLELDAALRQGATGFTLELRETELTTRALPGAAEPRGKLWGSIEVPDEPDQPLRLEGFLDGQAAGSPLWLEATWVGDDLYAQVNLPRLPASYVNSQVSGLALQGELSLSAEVQGTLPELELLAHARGAAAQVAVHGHAFLSDGLEGALALAANHINLAELVPDAPPSDLALDLDALVLEAEQGALQLSHRLRIDAGRVADVATPPAAVHGQLSMEETGELSASGHWQVAEPGASLGGRYRTSLGRTGDDFVAVSLAGELLDPPRAAALGVAAAGRVDGEAELWLDSELVKARLDLSLQRLDYQPGAGTSLTLQARTVELRSQLAGSLDDPRAHAAATLELLSGRAHADLDYNTRSRRASLFLADIDLHRVATLIGVQLPFEQGNLNADFTAQHEGASHEPIQVDGKLRADLGAAGALQLSAASLKVPSQLDGPSPWSRLSGELVASGKLDLAHTTRLAHLVGFPLERTTGALRFELAGKRSEGEAPELALTLDTNGLRIVERREPRTSIATTAEAVDNDPFALEGIDAHASLRFSPETGEALGTVIARDRSGTLALVEAEATLGRAWLNRLSQPQALLATPLRVHLEVPERRLQRLPPLLRPPGLQGRVALDAELAGSLLDPQARGWITLDRLRTQRGNETVALRANFRYTRGDGELFARAAGARGEDLARLNVSWQGDARQALTTSAPAGALVASADAELFGLPIEVLPILAEQQLKGRLTGRAQLSDWGKDAKLEARFDGRDLNVGTHALPAVLLAAHYRGDRIVAELGITTGKGSARAKLEADASWGARPAPELKRRGVAKLSTQRFELATFSPLLGAYLSELSGLLDADAQIVVDGAATRVSGTASLERGVVQLPAIGQRFSDISARVAVGNNRFQLQQLSARGSTGKLSATGNAALDGFALRSAELHANIRKQEALPVTIEGADLGDAWGNVKVTYQSPPTGERRLDVDVPEFHLTTPDAGGSSLQELDNADEIRIGTRRADGTFVLLPVQPLEPSTEEASASEHPAQPLRIRIVLGKNVTVARGATAQVQLTGQVLVLSDRETSVTGRIELKGGKLDVQGKTFEIERGVITFNGSDPSNPTITATARWDAPEHTVYAEYVGDVESGRIKLRAEPPLTQDQVASLLLFGDPDGSRGGTDPNTAALAVSVAGDTAAKGLNKALSDFTSLDVRARVDTTTGSARPELQLQVSPRVAAKVTRAIGEPALGESPDRTFLTLELRLRRGWALSALLGDHGASALDLIWRHRY